MESLAGATNILIITHVSKGEQAKKINLILTDSIAWLFDLSGSEEFQYVA